MYSCTTNTVRTIAEQMFAAAACVVVYVCAVLRCFLWKFRKYTRGCCFFLIFIIRVARRFGNMERERGRIGKLFFDRRLHVYESKENYHWTVERKSIRRSRYEKIYVYFV